LESDVVIMGLSKEIFYACVKINLTQCINQERESLIYVEFKWNRYDNNKDDKNYCLAKDRKGG
jgi:hypothetical protein